jgi:hypothetical protein
VLLKPRQLGLGLDERDDDDNVSDMSALPEDVRDAIENSDPGGWVGEGGGTVGGMGQGGRAVRSLCP